MPLFQFMGRSAAPVKYSSADTRTKTLDGFCGDALIEEVQSGMERLPIDAFEDLELRFQSGANRHDLPGTFGPMPVDRRLGERTTSLELETKGWVRRNGRPVR